MPRRATDNRTQKDRAAAVGISARHWRNYMRDDARFAQLVARKANDQELVGYLDAKRNGLKYSAPWEEDEEQTAEGAGGDEDLAEVSRRTKIARMAKMEEDALKAEIERKKMEGALISVEVVAAEYGRAMTALKNGIMAIGPSIRGELLEHVPEPTAAAEVERLIVECCRTQLETTSKSLL